ncbi:hypothetical protein C8Q75DRAFT_753023, partial [Abortiporus biennis]
MSTRAGASFGTNSPPIESTERSEPMGVTNIQGDKPKGVTDKDQRKDYLGGNAPEDLNPEATQTDTGSAQKTKL